MKSWREWFQTLRAMYCYLFHIKHWRRASELDGLDCKPYYGYQCNKCSKDYTLRENVFHGLDN